MDRWSSDCEELVDQARVHEEAAHGPAFAVQDPAQVSEQELVSSLPSEQN